MREIYSYYFVRKNGILHFCGVAFDAKHYEYFNFCNYVELMFDIDVL